MTAKPTNSNPTGKFRQMDPSAPDPDGIGAAVEVLKTGGVVVYPTAGLYGLGADALCASAVKKVFAIKRRPETRPVLVLISDLAEMDRLVKQVPDYARCLMALWPGRLTLVFEASRAVPALLTGKTGKIGIRLPAHPVAKALVAAFGGPITGTSANRSGFPPASRSRDLDAGLCHEADLVLDAGDLFDSEPVHDGPGDDNLAGGSGSTVVDVTSWPVRVIREGRLPVSRIQEALEQRKQKAAIRRKK